MTPDHDVDRDAEHDAGPHDETAVPFGGAAHHDARGDLRWVAERYNGNPAIGAFSFGLRKALRRCSSHVTFDRSSFQRAIAAAPAGALFVLAPSHRSYFDFLLTSYLCFARPELGIATPAIAAAEEFGKIPVIGAILGAAGAFYLKRGVGREAPELTDDLRKLAERGASLMVFVEGQRSRARRFLPAKRGILRGLAATGKTFAILPIAISYDRLAEERTLAHELAGRGRAPMSLPALAGWFAELARGRIQLGRIHLACGAPLVLDAAADVPALARTIIAEHQRRTCVTSFHLRVFLAETGLAPSGVTVPWLAGAIERRGGRVLPSDLPVPSPLPPALASSLRNQWLHWFYGDAVARHPDALPIRDHIARNAWSKPPCVAERCAQVSAVVDALFAPITRDFAAVVTHIAARRGAALRVQPVDLVRSLPAMHLPHVEDTCRALADRGILIAADGGYAWGPHPGEISAVIDELTRLHAVSTGVRKLG